MSVFFDEDSTCFEEFYDKLYELYLEFNLKVLMNFLKKSVLYDVVCVCVLFTGNKAFIFERVFLFFKFGLYEEVVCVFVMDVKDLLGVIKFVSELDNFVEFWNVIIKVLIDLKDFMATFFAYVKNFVGDFNVIVFIYVLCEGVFIDNFKFCFVDFMDENIVFMCLL